MRNVLGIQFSFPDKSQIVHSSWIKFKEKFVVKVFSKR